MPVIRSLFFAPANRPDLVAKFPRFAADCYVIDLEDGTPPAHKASARAGIAKLVADLESIAGVANAAALCRADASLAAVYFGAEDLASELGARRTAGAAEVQYARSHVLLHAKAARIVAIDQAVVEIRDDKQFEV